MFNVPYVQCIMYNVEVNSKTAFHTCLPSFAHCKDNLYLVRSISTHIYAYTTCNNPEYFVYKSDAATRSFVF